MTYTVSILFQSHRDFAKIYEKGERLKSKFYGSIPIQINQ